MELWEYAEVLIRWGWVIVLVTGLCAAGAIALIQLQTPRYTSVTEVNVTPARLELELSQEVANLLRNYVSSIQSEGMARRAVSRLGLQGIDPAQLQRGIEAEANEADFKIVIEVTDLDPLFAQQVSQVVAQLFVEDVQGFALRQAPRDRLTATMLNGGAQAAGQSWPRKKLLAFLGIGSGLVVGLLAALWLEWSRVERVQTPAEVETWTGLPVLASIPRARSDV
jgi:capsular polysaccharide biosynthesis protein